MFKSGLKGEIIYVQNTDCGLCYNVNQDAVAGFVQGNVGLFVLSDGMGGHYRGELASQWITHQFRVYWESLLAMGRLPDFKILVEQVEQEIYLVNRQVLERYNQGQICGATVVVLLIAGDCCAVFSVGDSRVYTFVNGRCSILTVDDIWDNLPSTQSMYTDEQIAVHSNRGKLVQTVGTGIQLNVHITTQRLKRRQVFLLCSDGLFKFCSEQKLKNYLRQIKSRKTMENALKKFFTAVYEQGARDNVTAILVQVK